ncbi:hypothetical protein PsorP6_002241 [Peronosclerospora sorghi]|uniref:Uncharacterized protein n=1 Tax=Peronosclerospora sorghi TaxID=230839 RepID=A0ACC0WSY6_9STRA|nr:hypothetical protein PsorP6_002241 [Peronosclerospora sorghi]
MMVGFTSGRNPRGYQKEWIVPVDDDLDPAVVDADKSSKIEIESVNVPPLPETSIPDVEWWDVEYLPKDKRVLLDKFGFIKNKARRENPDVKISYAVMKLKFSGTAHVIEHPVKLNLIVRHDATPVAVPLMLTAAVRVAH